MNDGAKRFALAALVGFFAFVFALPVSCCGFVLYNEHLYGDVERGGPEAILKARGLSAVVALSLAVLIWRKLRPR